MGIDLCRRDTLVSENRLKCTYIDLTVLIHKRRAGMAELMDRVGGRIDAGSGEEPLDNVLDHGAADPGPAGT